MNFNMNYITLFGTVVFVNFLAMASPGPDFLLVTRNTLKYSRRIGIASSFGIALGLLVHITYSLIGIAVLISKSTLLFRVIKYVGAAYLIYLGYKSLTSKQPSSSVDAKHANKDISLREAVKMGFMTNVTNPNVTLFFLSLFTVIIPPTTPLFLRLLMAAEMLVATLIWYSFISTLVSHHAVKSRFHQFQYTVEKIIGVVFILLAIKVALP